MTLFAHSRIVARLFQANPASAVPGGSYRGETASRHRFGNEDEPPMNTNRHQTDGAPSMTSGARMLLQYCDVGVTTSWEKGPRERGRPARTNPGIASPISSTRIERQRRHGSASAGTMRFPPAGGTGCHIAGKLSGNPRDSMRARRPRSRGVLSRWRAGGYPSDDFSESRPASFGKLPFVREPCPRRAGRIKPECNNQ